MPGWLTQTKGESKLQSTSLGALLLAVQTAPTRVLAVIRSGFHSRRSTMPSCKLARNIGRAITVPGGPEIGLVQSALITGQGSFTLGNPVRNVAKLGTYAWR